MARTPEQNRNSAATAGTIAALLLCLWGVSAHYKLESDYQRKNPDPFLVSEQFDRLRGIAQAVPEPTELGYFTDVPPESAEAPAMFLSAQYVLAPRLLVKDTSHEWVLGNFTRPADFAAIGERNGLILQQDFGNGVVLFRRRH